MQYVALLRGINVGGNNRVDMRQLKTCFEHLGLSNVKTYINSGNVIFSDTTYTSAQLVSKLEKEIEQEFGLVVKVLIRDLPNLNKVVQALPDHWVNDDTNKCDVMFLWKNIDSPKILDELPIKKEFEEVKYVPGAVLWCIERKNINKSRMLKIVGTKIYKEMTVRNCNTVRKLVSLMED
jgi:uncharacterized protein (DUF1697 family)